MNTEFLPHHLLSSRAWQLLHSDQPELDLELATYFSYARLRYLFYYLLL